MSIELKPCPFCGGNDLAVESATPDWSVACLNPACPVKPDCWSGFSRKEAVEGWNTRALEAENAALRAELAARGPVLSDAELDAIDEGFDAITYRALGFVGYPKHDELTAHATVLRNLLERAKR